MEQAGIQTGTPEKPRRKRGEGRIWQIGRIWWIQYYVHGRQVRESSHSEKRAVAERLLKRRLGEREAGILPMPKAERVRYEEMRDALYADYRVNNRKSLTNLEEGKEVIWGVQHLDTFFRDHRAVDITTDRIREFIDKRQAAGASSASINRALAALRRMFHLAVQDGKLRDIPHFPMLKEPPARKGFLEHEDYIKLRDALPDHLKPVLAVGYYTGMRLGEILPLRWEQVNLIDREIRLDPGTTKNDEARTVPLCSELAAILMVRFQTRDRDCPYVFASKEAHLVATRKQWIRACVKAGLGTVPTSSNGKLILRGYRGLRFHDLRRTGIRNLVRAGVPERVAMAISGHKTRAVFERYNIVSGRDLKEAAKKLDTYLDSKKGANSGQMSQAGEASASQPSSVIN